MFLCSLKILGHVLSIARVSRNIEGKLLAFVEGAHTRTLDSRNVNEHIRTACIDLDETKALGIIEEFYSSSIHDDFLSIGREKSVVEKKIRQKFQIDSEEENHRRQKKARKKIGNNIDLDIVNFKCVHDKA